MNQSNSLIEFYRESDTDFLLFTLEDLDQMIAHCLSRRIKLGGLAQDYDDLIITVLVERGAIPAEQNIQ